LQIAEVNETTSQTTLCANCGAVLVGQYCHQCGQKKVERHDFSVRHFFRHIVHEFTHLDSNKILRTLSALFFKPGKLTAEYLAGRKGAHINPIRIYLSFSALYFLFAWGALSDIRGGGVERTARNPRTIAMARQKGMEPLAFSDKVHGKAEKYAAVLRFASVLMSGLFLTVLYLRMKKYYVEHLIFSLHFYSFDFGVKSLFALLFITAHALGRDLPEQVLNLFYPIAFIYLTFALRKVYQQTWPLTLLKSSVLFICETLLFIAVNIAGFIIAFSLI
jgi:hypothetical protein